MLDTHARKYTNRLFSAIAALLLRLELTPNQVTALAFILGITIGAVLYGEHPMIAVALLWLSGLLDAVDGEMARRSGRSSVRGAQMDIISDRLVELSIVWGLALRRPLKRAKRAFITRLV